MAQAACRARAKKYGASALIPTCDRCPVSLFERLVFVCVPAPCVAHAQAAPLKQQRKENSTKKWNKGAPHSKATKMPGIGRGKNPNSHGNKSRKEEAEEQLQTVPLPADREVIKDPTVRIWMESPNRDRPSIDPLPQQPQQPPIQVALAPSDADDDDLPPVRGWLQREISAGVREAPVAQATPVAQ